MVLRFKFFICFLLIINVSHSQSLNPIYKQLLDSLPNKVCGFAIEKSEALKKVFNEKNFLIKYESETHFFVNAPLKWMDDNSKLGNIPRYSFDPMQAELLGDTVRARRFVDPVHLGAGGLTQPYTGKDVVIGFIDYGLEINHPDFIEANGDTRILRLWDQTNGSSFSSYGYGKLWDSTSINNGSCTFPSTNDHGSTVAGVGAGNGLANGKNKGVAPDANIVFINLDLSAGYQTRIVDACDYIFKYADSLGLPAVVNIGVGSPYGVGHDGNDPFTEYVESLITAKNGRIVLASAGNYGNYGNYHLRGDVTPDTTFTWFKPNPSFGNIVYFEVFSDTSDSHFNFSIGANKSSGTYEFRGRSNFRDTYDQLGLVVADTIWNGTNMIASYQTYSEMVDSAYHLEIYIDRIDSVNYNFSFLTEGLSGSYDLWNATNVLTNDIVENIPSSSVLPEIVNYQLPDSLNTLAAYFMNSEKIISVGNFNNRQGYTDFNGNFQDFSSFPSGQINPTSSRGPNRLGYMKPDVSANGNLSFAAAALSTLSNPGLYDKILQEGWHHRNGGTSMAAPVISGMAALYLEKCSSASYMDFKRDVIRASEKDVYTGPTPNYSYGYGKPNALKLLLDKDSIAIDGGPYLCSSPLNLSSDLGSYLSLDSVVWSTTDNSISLNVNSPGFYSAEIYYGNGCKVYSDTLEVVSILPSVPSSFSKTQPTCVVSTGEIEVNVQANVLYSLGGVSQVSNVFSVLSPGNYLITVKSQLDTTCFVDAAERDTLYFPTNMSIDPIAPISFCDSVALPIIIGLSLSGNEAYFTSKDRGGVRYNTNDFIDTGIVKLYVNDSLGICNAEDSMFFISYKPNTPSFLSVVQPTCVFPYGEIQFNAQPNVDYSLGGVLQSSNTFSSLDTGSYVLTVKNQIDTLCVASNSLPVVLDSPTNMTINPLTSPISFCDTLILPTITGVSLSGNEAFFTSSNRGGARYNSSDVIDTNILKLYLNDSLGICSAEDSVFFSIVSGDDASFIYPDFCENSTPTVNVSGLVGGVFNFDSLPIDGALINGSTGQISNFTGGSSYRVKYTTNGSCPRSSVDTVFVLNVPSAPITDYDSLEISSVQISISASAIGSTIKWYSDSLLNNLLHTGISYSLIPAEDIYVTETTNGCESSPKRILVYDIENTFSNSAFTPNDDNVNDLWVLEGLDSRYPYNIVTIYNRWGEVVYESEKGKYEQNSWDGKKNSQALPTGSYYYIVNCNDGKGSKMEGTVTIIK
jgi:gliding motility-associated-like protein